MGPPQQLVLPPEERHWLAPRADAARSPDPARPVPEEDQQQRRHWRVPRVLAAWR